MRIKFLGAIAVALLLVLMFAVVAQAAVPQSTIDAIIKDARDGTIDGNWTAAEIRAALAYVRTNPTLQAYSETSRVFSRTTWPACRRRENRAVELAFTGGEVFLVLAAGAALIGGGALLRRSQA